MKKKNRIYERIFRIIKKPEWFFIMVASFFGILFILIIPPLQTPDEHVHFYRAYEVSELNRNRVEKDGVMGSMLPSSIEKTWVATNALTDNPAHIQFNPHNKYDLGYTKHALLDIPLDREDKSFFRTETYPMFVYTPQALAVTVGKIFDAPIIVMIYLTRIVNLILWLTVVFMCIKYFPWKKWAMVGVCLLPMVVAQTASPGLDVLAMAGVFAFITLVLRLVHDKQTKLDIRMLSLLLITGVAMVFAKSILAVFLPLIFLVKQDKLDIKYRKITKYLIVVLPIALFVLWTVLIASSSTGQAESTSSQQVSMLLHQPLNFIHLLGNTLFFATHSGYLVVQSIVGNFGWLDTPLSPFITFLGIAYITFLLIVGIKGDKYRIPNKVRKALLISGVATAIAAFLAMYVYDTLPTDNNIKGVQGRYLVPSLIALVPVLAGTYIITSRQLYTRVVRWGSVSLLLISGMTIIARYYYVFIPT